MAATLPPAAQTVRTAGAEWLDTIAAQGYINVYINFEASKAIIRPQYRSIIDTIVAMLTTDTALELSIEGHTDNTGDTAKNYVLSVDRAKAVWQALVARGIRVISTEDAIVHVSGHPARGEARLCRGELPDDSRRHRAEPVRRDVPFSGQERPFRRARKNHYQPQPRSRERAYRDSGRRRQQAA